MSIISELRKWTYHDCALSTRILPLYIAVIYLTKAFDLVSRDGLFKVLPNIGKYVKIIINLYWVQTASVRIVNELSDEIRIQRRVRQVCVASPTLFNLCTEKIFRHIINMKCVNVGSNNYNNLR